MESIMGFTQMGKTGIVSLMVVVTVAYAGRVKKEKVETKILQLPKISIESADYNGLTVEYSTGDISLGKAVSGTEKTICTPKGKIDPVEVQTQFLQVEYTGPEFIIVAKNASGEVVFAEKLGTDAKKTAKYGENECRFFLPGSVHKAWEKEKGKFKQELLKKEIKAYRENIDEIISSALFATYQKEEFNVYYVDGKHSLSNELKEACDNAVSVYEDYAQNGYSLSVKEKLQKSIDTWQKALKQSDIGDRKAFINHKATLKMHENLGVAYMYLNDYESALLHFNKIRSLERSTTTVSIFSHYSQVKNRALQRITGVARNKDVLSDIDKIQTALRDAQRYRSRVSAQYQSGSFSQLESAYKEYMAETGQENRAFAQSAGSAAVAAGKANPYESEVTYAALQGYAFMKTPLMALGAKYQEVPVELCSIEHLNQILITHNEVARVPKEIGQLKNLKVLNLKNNKISELPEELGDLESIEVINLANNNLTSLPQSIGKLKTLKKLVLKNNAISKDEIKRLKSALPDCRIKN